MMLNMMLSIILSATLLYECENNTMVGGCVLNSLHYTGYRDTNNSSYELFFFAGVTTFLRTCDNKKITASGTTVSSSLCLILCIGKVLLNWTLRIQYSDFKRSESRGCVSVGIEIIGNRWSRRGLLG